MTATIELTGEVARAGDSADFGEREALLLVASS